MPIGLHQVAVGAIHCEDISVISQSKPQGEIQGAASGKGCPGASAGVAGKWVINRGYTIIQGVSNVERVAVLAQRHTSRPNHQRCWVRALREFGSYHLQRANGGSIR